MLVAFDAVDDIASDSLHCELVFVRTTLAAAAAISVRGSDDAPALARRCRNSSLGFGAICGRGRLGGGDLTAAVPDIISELPAAVGAEIVNCLSAVSL